ncbi:MAG: ROK family protein [Fusobacteriaceae bacterium]
MYQKKNRKTNEKNFFNYIYNTNDFTITDISENIGITFPTAKNIIEKFVKESIVFKLNKMRIDKGKRRAQLYKLNEKGFYSIGVKVEVETIQIALVDLKGSIIKESIIKNISYQSGELKIILFNELNYFCDYLDDIIKNKILGIGFSLPGTVDKKNLVFIVGTNLHVYNTDFKELEEKLKYKIFLENEANASAISEKIIGVAKNISDFIFVSINSGIGGGIYINNSLYDGTDGMSGEIGHMKIVINGKKCNCGGVGCWELYASEDAFLNLVRKKFQDINSIDDIFSVKKNRDLTKIIDEYIKYLAIGIKNFVMIFNPQKIIIGGKISKYHSFIEEQVKEFVFKDNLLYKNEKNRIIFSKHEDRGNLLGAALLPIIDKFF